MTSHHLPASGGGGADTLSTAILSLDSNRHSVTLEGEKLRICSRKLGLSGTRIRRSPPGTDGFCSHFESATGTNLVTETAEVFQ